MNLPRVADASFQSAPTGSYAVAFPDEDTFQVIPHHLEGNRYLQDLLQNHAPDPREKKDEIERLYERFDALRDEFRQEFDAGIVNEAEELTLEPADYFSQWIFEFLVAYERGIYEDFDDVRERALSQLGEGDTGQHPDEPRVNRNVNVYTNTVSGYSLISN